jgi:hypothetical protein
MKKHCLLALGVAHRFGWCLSLNFCFAPEADIGQRLPDHLVGAREQRRWYDQVERVRRAGGIERHFYGRISTADFQDRLSSARWQRDFILDLVDGPRYDRGRLLRRRLLSNEVASWRTSSTSF